MAEGTSVRVYLRMRPFNSREKALGNLVFPIELEEEVLHIPSRKNKMYQFDRNFGEQASQADVFKVVGHAVCHDFIEGFNATQFVYGQTGAGKSWTMMGVKANPELCGMIPRTSALLFDKIMEKPEGWKFEIEASYLEIYMEKVNDLLDNDKQNLPVKESKTEGVYVPGLTKEQVATVDDIFNIIDRGDSIRKVAATKMNAGSSRSHSVLSIYLSQTTPSKEEMVSQLNMVDLAGSERADKTGATGEVLKQGTLINLSLTTLSQVISALSKNAGGGKKTMVPYRDSKLTRILQTSLGGNAKTGLSIHVSPHIDNLDESISTMEFGKRAKMIKNNAKMKVKKSAEQLQKELDKMERLYEDLKDEYTKISGGSLPAQFGSAMAHGHATQAAAEGKVPTSAEAAELAEKVKELEDEIEDASKMSAVLKEEIEELHTTLAEKDRNITEHSKDLEVKDLEIKALQHKLAELGEDADDDVDFEDAEDGASSTLRTQAVKGFKASDPKSNAQIAEMRDLVSKQKDMLNRSRLENKELKQENLELTDELEEKTRRLALAELQVMRYEHARNRVKDNRIKIKIKSKPNPIWKNLLPGQQGAENVSSNNSSIDYEKRRKGTVLERFGGLYPVPDSELKGGREGPLEERLYQKTKFVKRWFVLRDSFLLCFEAQDSSPTEPRFCIPLADSKIGSCPKQGEHEYCFMVLCGTYFNVMAAGTESEKNVWLKDLNDAKLVTHATIFGDAYFTKAASTVVPDPTEQSAILSRINSAPYSVLLERDYVNMTSAAGGMEGFLSSPGFKVLNKASMFSKELRKEWKPTYFVLNCSHLLLFDLENHSELITEPRGVFYVGHPGVQVLEQHDETDEDDSSVMRFYFTLVNEQDGVGQALSLCASSAEERSSWILALKAAQSVNVRNVLHAALIREEVSIKAQNTGGGVNLLGQPLDPLSVQVYDDSSKPLFLSPQGKWVTRDNSEVKYEDKRFSKTGQPLDFLGRPLPQNAAPMFAKDPVEPVCVGVDGKHYSIPSYQVLSMDDPHYDFEGHPLHPETVKAAVNVLDDLKTACIVRSAVFSRAKDSSYDCFGRRLVPTREGTLLTKEGGIYPSDAPLFDSVGQPKKRTDLPAHVVKTLDIQYVSNDGETETIGKLGVEVGHTNLADLYTKIRSSMTTKISTLTFLDGGCPVPEMDKPLRFASEFLPALQVSCRDIHGKRMKWDGKVFIGDIDHEEIDAQTMKKQEDDFAKAISSQKMRKSKHKSRTKLVSPRKQ